MVKVVQCFHVSLQNAEFSRTQILEKQEVQRLKHILTQLLGSSSSPLLISVTNGNHLSFKHL